MIAMTLHTKISRLTVAALTGVALLLLVGATYWVFQEPRSAGAAVLVQAACAEMTAPYDAVATTSTPVENARWETSYSGHDYHQTRTITSKQGAVLHRQEKIIKDGTFYFRQTTRTDPNTYSPWAIMDTNVPHVEPLPCLDRTSYTRSSDDPNAAAYSSVLFLSQQEGSVRNEFWVDSSNRPTRAQRTFLKPPQPGSQTRSSDSDVTIDFTYSGFGDPNTITTPTVPEAPTPTPTPTATPTPTPTPLDGNPRAESVTGTSVTISWDRFRVGGVLPQDYRANYRQSSDQSWTFGSYADIPTFNNVRPRTTVNGLQCNTEYEFLVEVQLGEAWNHYGELTARTGGC